MNAMNFIKGVGVGIVVGSAVGMMVTPPKKSGKKKIEKAIKTVGTVIDEVSSALL